MSNPNDFQDEKPLSHNYDGIEELDNPLPGWWLFTFFITIIFGFLYWIHYDIGKAGLSSDDELKASMQKIQSLQQKAQAEGPKVDDAALLALVENADALSAGKAEYIAKCAACHGEKGEGLIGPNLTDKNWIHSPSPTGIYQVVAQGVLDKGMPAWKGLIAEDLLGKVVAYVVSIKGTMIPGKEAQGETVEP